MKKTFDWGKRLKELRQQRGMSQESLALSAGITPAYLGMIERGEKNPTVRVMEQVCDAMQISLSDFFVSSQKEELDFWSVQILLSLRDKNQEEKELFYKIIQNVLKLQTF